MYLKCRSGGGHLFQDFGMVSVLCIYCRELVKPLQNLIVNPREGRYGDQKRWPVRFPLSIARQDLVGGLGYVLLHFCWIYTISGIM